ncbi:MAG TPA: hypothetical protein DCL41_02460 [Bdellovibrionales bacterium]|nr:hypothetical protein [Pseudobdellovibrionaceae bacterium]HAG90703.1 hypothetical protein [Bdellovibrionales bacterium]|tara:strand:+ start:122 stop:529 length:408 start_codon:yes stop_codon:yes gene_type:complete
MIIAFPMAVYVFYIFLIGIFNFLTRVQSAKTGKVRLSYFQTYEGAAPDTMVMVGRHYDNQFQVPMLFLISCLATYNFHAVNGFAVGLAWVFVGSRVLHTYVHLKVKNVLLRARVYALGLLCVVALWINILVHAAN